MIIRLSFLGISSTVAYRSIAALRVGALPKNRLSGHISSVPPARSMRVGAELFIKWGGWPKPFKGFQSLYPDRIQGL